MAFGKVGEPCGSSVSVKLVGSTSHLGVIAVRVGEQHGVDVARLNADPPQVGDERAALHATARTAGRRIPTLGFARPPSEIDERKPACRADEQRAEAHDEKALAVAVRICVPRLSSVPGYDLIEATGEEAVGDEGHFDVTDRDPTEIRGRRRHAGSVAPCAGTRTVSRCVDQPDLAERGGTPETLCSPARRR